MEDFKKHSLIDLAAPVLAVACGLFHCDLRGFCCGMWALSWGMWDLVPWSGMEPGPLVLGAQSLSHWTTREVLQGRSPTIALDYARLLYISVLPSFLCSDTLNTFGNCVNYFCSLRPFFPAWLYSPWSWDQVCFVHDQMAALCTWDARGPHRRAEDDAFRGEAFREAWDIREKQEWDGEGEKVMAKCGSIQTRWLALQWGDSVVLKNFKTETLLLEARLGQLNT